MDLTFDTVGLSTEEAGRFTDTCKALKAKFDIHPTGHIDFNLEQFEIFKKYLYVKIRDSYVIKNAHSDCYLFFIAVHYQTRAAKGAIVTDHKEYQTWALSYVKRDFGRVMIRPETLADKLIELLHPIELDFAEDKPFSDTFYVLINNHEKAVNAMDRNFRNAVMDIRTDDVVIEIVEHTLIIGNKKPVSAEKAVHLAEFVVRLCGMC